MNYTSISLYKIIFNIIIIIIHSCIFFYIVCRFKDERNITTNLSIYLKLHGVFKWNEYERAQWILHISQNE